MKKMINTLIVIVSLGITSCGDKVSSADGAGFNTFKSKEVFTDVIASEQESSPNIVNQDIPKPIEQKLIKNGIVSFRVKNIRETKANVKRVVASMNGYISKENSSGSNENPSEEVIVRIPNKNFDKFIDEILKGAEEVDSKTVDIEDVTEQFVDIEARLKNKKQLEAKYQELLKKANNMEDILKIEEQISSIREDIEASEGRLRYLGSRVDYSTINLSFYERRTTGFNFGGKLGKAMENGGTGFLWFIIGFMSLWPLWIFGLVLWFVIARIIKRYKSKKITPPTA